VVTKVNQLKRVTEALFETGHFLDYTRRHERGIDRVAVATLDDGTSVRVPQTGVITFEPPHPTPSGIDLLFSSGIHGNETAPIEICCELVAEILCGDLPVSNRVMFVIGNPVAVNLGKRFESENLNRLFMGAHESSLVPGSYESVRAAELEVLVGEFFEKGQQSSRRLHYDMHTAIRGSKIEKFAARPFCHGLEPSTADIEVLGAAGIHTIVISTSSVGTFSYFSSRAFGSTSFTVELGQVRPFGENDMSKFAAIMDVIRHMVRGEDVVVEPFENKDYNVFAVERVLFKTSDEFVLHLADDVLNFTELPLGFVLTEDGDERYVVATQGECIVFPNPYVKTTQRAGMTLVPISL